MKTNPSRHPNVSIITPSFNQGEFLEQAIDSVLSQNYKNLEYIIIDGGSTDNSVEIIKNYEKHLSYWESKKDNGQGEAINRGISLAKGELVSWLNSDDCYLPNCINKLTNGLLNDPKSGLIFAQVEVINSTNQHVGIFKPSKTDFNNILCFRSIIPQQASLFRKDVFHEVGGINENLHFALDHDLFLRIAYRYPIIQLDELLAQYRISKTNKGYLNRSSWSPEFISLLDDFFLNKEIPSKIKNMAYAQAYYLGGCGYLDDHLYSKARGMFINSISYSRWTIFDIAWMSHYLRTFVGKFGNDFYQMVKLFLARKGLIDYTYDWWTSMLILEQDNLRNNPQKDH